MQENRFPRAALVALTLLLGLFLFPSIAAFLVDRAWFSSLGYGAVFTTQVRAQLIVGAAAGLLMAAALLINARLALRFSPKPPRPFPGQRIDYAVFHRLAGRAANYIAWPIALLTGLAAAGQWQTALQYYHGGDFGVVDPLFGADVGFFVFTLPAAEALYGFLQWMLLLCLATSAGLYALRGSLHSLSGELYVAPTAKRHLLLLLSFVFLNIAFGTWLEARGLVFSDTGPVTGASYADVQARLPGLRVEIGAAALAAALSGIAAFRKRWVLVGAGVALLVAVHVLGVVAYPSLVQRFSVLPNEAQREAQLIERNIEATRTAFGLANVVERDLSSERALQWEDIEANRPTLSNVRLWDHRPLLDSFAQIQEIRTYYEFASVDNDRYVLDGELRQTMLSARELAASSLPNRTWINEHFTFTHGYGVTLGPVNEATEEGLPRLFVQDIPPVSTQPEIDVTEPAIYFGELTDNYVFVGTETREFDHPTGEENAYASYSGQDGIALDSFWQRLLVSATIGNFKLLLSNDIRPDSRVLLHRQITERVRRIAPFLRYDADPYMVVREDGSLMWILDAYTVSRAYPFAERTESGTNYIRNSVKVTIDAYDGTTRFFINDADDPIIAMWSRVFPELFEPIERLESDLQAHLRYPEDLFRLQANVFSVYHMDQAEDVYNREDQWELPAVGTGGAERRMEPYYTVMRLPGEAEEEFILMLPYTPKAKQNLAAWMVARSDGDARGELIVYRFPKDRLIFGPAQIMNRIQQDADISRQVSLWDQRGSQAIFGTLLVIPVEESLLYVAPLYLRSDGGRIPELKRVIVATGNTIAMERTLDGALAALFDRAPEESAAPESSDEVAGDDLAGAESAPSTAASLGEGQDLRVRARTLFQSAIEAQRAGDWAMYGERIDALGETLEALVAAPAGAETVAPDTAEPGGQESDGATEPTGEASE
ncbi:MAG: UPF0182 family protein [Myxococcota bacterium]